SQVAPSSPSTNTRIEPPPSSPRPGIRSFILTLLPDRRHLNLRRRLPRQSSMLAKKEANSGPIAGAVGFEGRDGLRISRGIPAFFARDRGVAASRRPLGTSAAFDPKQVRRSDTNHRASVVLPGSTRPLVGGGREAAITRGSLSRGGLRPLF